MADGAFSTFTLSDTDLLRSEAYLAGDWVGADGGATFDVTNPSTGAVIAAVPDMGVAETRRAIDAAYAAQKDWAARTGKERGMGCTNGRRTEQVGMNARLQQGTPCAHL